MDTITHAITGAVMSGPAKEKLGWIGAAAVLAGSLAPDADMPLALLGKELYFRYHRTVTNSVTGIIAIPLLVAFAIWLFKRQLDFKTVWLLVLLGYSAHIFMDLTNAYGSPLLWPFSSKWYSLDWVFIIDPWVTGLMAVSLALMLFKVKPVPVAVVCFSLLVGYWGVKAAMHSSAVAAVKAKFPGAVKVGAFPAPVDPFKWRVIVEEDETYHTGWVNLRDGSWSGGRDLAMPPFNDAARQAAGAPNASAFLDFARFPLLSYERLPDGWLVRFKDLRFNYRPGDNRFVATVRLGDDGKIKEDTFEF